jgi:hypothetical protein
VDQHAAPLPAELPQCGSGAVDIAEEVDLDHAAPDVVGNVFEATEGDDTCIIEPNIDAAKPIDRTAGQFLDILGTGHVRWHRESGPTKLAALLRYGLQHLGTTRRQDHGRSACGKLSRRSPPMPLDAPVTTTVREPVLGAKISLHNARMH